MIPIHPCPSIKLAGLLANEEIARAQVGHVVSKTPGDYLEFVQTQLHGCLASIPITSVTFFPPKVNLHLILHLLYSLFQLLQKYMHVALLGFII